MDPGPPNTDAIVAGSGTPAAMSGAVPALGVASREEQSRIVQAHEDRLKAPPVEVSEGLLDASLVHPREVFKKAILSTSAAVILAHNHPSGDTTPSAEDIKITRQLVEAGKIIDIKVLDHIIIGNPEAHQQGGFLSMREAGLVEFK